MMKYKVLDIDRIVDEKYLRDLLFEYEIDDIYQNMDDYLDGTYSLTSQLNMLKIALYGEMDVVLYHLSSSWQVDVEILESEVNK